MKPENPGTEKQSNQEKPPTLSRRTVLKAGTTAAVGAAGLAASTGTAAALDIETIGCTKGWQEAPDDYPTIDLTQENPSTTGNFPEDADEILIYVHGLLEDLAGDAPNQGFTLQQALRRNGYQEPTVTAVWDSNTLNFFGAEKNADTAGQRLASWLDDYLTENPGTTIRTVNHSLGTRVILTALNELDGSHVLEDVALVGGAVNPDTVCSDGRYASGIRNSADQVNNFHSRKDRIVCTLYAFTSFTSAVGCRGSDCGGWFRQGSTPPNYEDINVSGSVSEHCDYVKPEVGAVPQIVNSF